MGFARRVVRKTVRKATPRPVRRAMHPVRTAKHAVTPRSVKQLSRVAYTVTNPLGAAENALIGAALSGGRRRGSSSRRAASRRPAVSRLAGPPSAADMRATEGATAASQIATVMAAGRERFEAARHPVIPAPVAISPKPYIDELWRSRRAGLHCWQGQRLAQLREWADRQGRALAAADWTTACAEHAVAQQAADRWWEALNAGDHGTVVAALTAAYADNPAPVTDLAVTGDGATLTVRLPGLEVLPDRKPDLTPGGRLTSKAWGKTERNNVYADLLGAHLLATARETWAVAPSLNRLRVLGCRDQNGIVERLFDLEVTRTSADWENDSAGAHLLETHSGGLTRTGRTLEVVSS